MAKEASRTVYFAAGDVLFEWNAAKAVKNEKTHGIGFETAAEVFLDPRSIVQFDSAHSTDELRYATIGLTSRGPLVVAFHTDRGDRIRLISARKATAREKKRYAEK